MFNKYNKNTLSEFASDVSIGLGNKKKQLPPKYFYDDTGSRLFEKICIQPEYYPTRTEYDIMKDNLTNLINDLDLPLSIVELGSGNSKKTFLLLETFAKIQKPHTYYFPIDVSHQILHESSKFLSLIIENLKIHYIHQDFFKGLKMADDYIKSKKNISIPENKLVVFLGSSIGNFEPEQARLFLSNIRKNLKLSDCFLIGFDLQKDPHLIESAYNDKNGLTSMFNINILHRINKELGGNFNIDYFEHMAFYNQKENRIEMHLVSKIDQKVYIKYIEKTFHFQKNETIHTENSYKYTKKQIEDLSNDAGFSIKKHFFDKNNWFVLSLLKPF